MNIMYNACPCNGFKTQGEATVGHKKQLLNQVVQVFTTVKYANKFMSSIFI